MRQTTIFVSKNGLFFPTIPGVKQSLAVTDFNLAVRFSSLELANYAKEKAEAEIGEKLEARQVPDMIRT